MPPVIKIKPTCVIASYGGGFLTLPPFSSFPSLDAIFLLFICCYPFYAFYLTGMILLPIDSNRLSYRGPIVSSFISLVSKHI